MATAENTIPPQGVHLDWPNRDEPAYLIPKDMEREDVASLLEVKIQHLVAMLEVTHGIPAEALRDHGGPTREYFMWACSMLAREIHSLWRAHDYMLMQEAIAAAGAPEDAERTPS